MAQTVTVPGVGDLQFPDGMSQPDMAAAIQKNFPQIHPGGVVPPAAPPSITDKIRNGIGAGLNLASDTIDGIVGMTGHGAGLLGGLAGALGVQLRGGVQPDDPRVVAAGTGPVAGADARPLAAGGRGTGEVAVPQTAIDEAGQQTAQSAIGAVHQASGLGERIIDPAGIGAKVRGAFQTPGARDIANDVQAPGGIMAHIDPQVGMTMHVPEGAAGNAAAAVGTEARVATAPLARAADVVGGAVKRAVPAGIAKVLPAADPELVKVAQLADQFPHPMRVMPDRLLPEGAAKTIAEDVGKAPLTGGSQIEHANAQNFTKNTIDQLDEGSAADRLNSTTLNAGLDKQGAKIGAGYEQAGPLAADDVRNAMQAQLAKAIDEAPPEVSGLVQRRFDGLMEKVGPDGTIPPQALREWDTAIGKQARRLDSDDAAGHLSDLQGNVRDLVESKLTNEQAAVVKDARRRYAYVMLLEPSVGKAGRAGSVVGLNGLVEPGKLINALTSNRAGTSFMARGRAGPMGDLARVGQLMDNVAKPDVGAAALAHGAMKVLGAGTGVSSAVGKVYNKAAPAVTRMLVPKVEKPPVAVPPELELAPPGASNPAAPAAPANPLGDLTPDWQTAPGAAPPNANGAPIDATGLHPALGEERQAVLPQGSGPGREIPAVPGRPGDAAAPLGDLTPDWQTTGPPVARPGVDATDLHPAVGDNVVTTGNRAPPAAGQPGSQIPAVPGRPDLPDTMASGRPGETAATDIANAAMHEPGAVAARAETKKAAEPKPNAAERTRLDEIDKTLAGTQSDIVRETLEKERARVMKDVAARDTLEKTKAAAAELRTSAETITDPATKKALLAKADKLDPPPAPKAKLADLNLPSIEYADTPEWRASHGLGPEDAQRAVLTRKAFDLDADAVEAAAVQHASSPRAFDRVVDQILEKHRANEASPAAQSGQSPEVQKPGAGGNVGAKPAAADERGAQSPSGAGAGGGGQPVGRTAPGPALEDAHAEAARLAKFHLDHPRASDGTFTEKE
jgi:hypothetical protein